MEPKEALEKIRADKELTKDFLYEPKETLEKLGVDTANLKIEAVDPQEAGLLKASICGSIGYIACVSVGS